MVVNWVDRGSDKRGLQVTRAASEAAARAGLTADRLIEMAYLGAFVTHPHANRRFGDFIMQVEKDTIYGVWPYTETRACDDGCSHVSGVRPAAQPHQRARSVQQADSVLVGRYARRTYRCPICEGEGNCMECRGKGTINRTAEEYEDLKQLAAIR